MLKPMDIHSVEFKRSFKGYDPDEVDDYLASIASKYQNVYLENKRLQEELKLMKEELESKAQQEQDVLDLISLTKQTVREIKNMANQEAGSLVNSAKADAARIISEARRDAQKIISDAEANLAQIQRSEVQLKEKVRLTMETIWNLLNEENSDEKIPTRPYQEIASILEDLEDEKES
ncbi:MAG: DivIVA domain-containing protein [Firmicutes bacterium]|nr:DivIVA domain-containing protein [Bacillota bacterium]